MHGNRELGTRPGDVRRLVEHELGESVFPAPLVLNVVPFVGHHVGDGWTSEEVKVREETRKILDIPHLPVSATCVRVPVVSSHSVTVHATFARRVRVAEARQALVEAPAVVVLDDPDEPEFPTPNDVVGADPRFAGPHPAGSGVADHAGPVHQRGQPAQGRGAQHGRDRRARRPRAHRSVTRPPDRMVGG